MMKNVHFRKTREYLEQVKEAAQKVEMLKKRIDLYENVGMDADELSSELEFAMKDLALRMVTLADMIGRIPKVEYQWLLTKRYVELLDWFDIASTQLILLGYSLSIFSVRYLRLSTIGIASKIPSTTCATFILIIRSFMKIIQWLI